MPGQLDPGPVVSATGANRVGQRRALRKSDKPEFRCHHAEHRCDEPDFQSDEPEFGGDVNANHANSVLVLNRICVR